MVHNIVKIRERNVPANDGVDRIRTWTPDALRVRKILPDGLTCHLDDSSFGLAGRKTPCHVCGPSI